MKTPIQIIDLQQEAQDVQVYKNMLLSSVNNHVVRMGIMTEPYFWHFHPNSDETFIGLEGILCIDLENQAIELSPGQMVTIPASVKHRTRPKGDRSVNLTIELETMETVRCDDNGH